MFLCCIFFFFKQKTAYELRISDWSSDVCSSDLESSDVNKQALEQIRQDLGLDQPLIVQYGKWVWGAVRDRKSVVQGKSVSVRVDLGGRRIITKKNSQRYFRVQL